MPIAFCTPSGWCSIDVDYVLYGNMMTILNMLARVLNFVLSSQLKCKLSSTIDSNIHIRGGSILYLLKVLPYLNDIDIFCVLNAQEESFDDQLASCLATFNYKCCCQRGAVACDVVSCKKLVVKYDTGKQVHIKYQIMVRGSLYNVDLTVTLDGHDLTPDVPAKYDIRLMNSGTLRSTSNGLYGLLKYRHGEAQLMPPYLKNALLKSQPTFGAVDRMLKQITNGGYGKGIQRFEHDPDWICPHHCADNNQVTSYSAWKYKYECCGGQTCLLCLLKSVMYANRCSMCSSPLKFTDSETFQPCDYIDLLQAHFPELTPKNCFVWFSRENRVCSNSSIVEYGTQLHSVLKTQLSEQVVTSHDKFENVEHEEPSALDYINVRVMVSSNKTKFGISNHNLDLCADFAKVSLVQYTKIAQTIATIHKIIASNATKCDTLTIPTIAFGQPIEAMLCANLTCISRVIDVIFVTHSTQHSVVKSVFQCGSPNDSKLKFVGESTKLISLLESCETLRCLKFISSEELMFNMYFLPTSCDLNYMLMYFYGQTYLQCGMCMHLAQTENKNNYMIVPNFEITPHGVQNLLHLLRNEPTNLVPPYLAHFFWKNVKGNKITTNFDILCDLFSNLIQSTDSGAKYTFVCKTGAKDASDEPILCQMCGVLPDEHAPQFEDRMRQLMIKIVCGCSPNKYRWHCIYCILKHIQTKKSAKVNCPYCTTEMRIQPTIDLASNTSKDNKTIKTMRECLKELPTLQTFDSSIDISENFVSGDEIAHLSNLVSSWETLLSPPSEQPPDV